jgi:murein DD-endopeptidase MepM/ murein hydrolase activator NlpD
MLRWLTLIALLAAIVAAALFIAAGRGAPPLIVIAHPERLVGQASTLELTVGAPGARLDQLSVTLEQNGKSFPLVAALEDVQRAPDATGKPGTVPTMVQTDADHVRVVRTFGKQSIPELQSGAARLVVSASRKSFLSLRMLSDTVSRDVQVRLEPPRISVLSTHHFVNHGGAEMVVYRTTPPDVRSGVRVGDVEYVGYPASGAGLAGAAGADDLTRLAFFALLHDQHLATPIVAFARDEAGNEAVTSFVDKVFEKPFRRSRIEIDDRFVQRVVPEILSHAPELGVQVSSENLVPEFVKINSDLRTLNAATIQELNSASSPTRLWSGSFVPLGNAKVEASFADHRVYLYKGQEIDRQVHLGFDLAVTTGIPIKAANGGHVLLAQWLGIYGNCIILDHGMGVASLYGHLSSLDVKRGDSVARGQVMGRSGMTGLAAGDHLHFTMLVGGRAVNPVEWWDPHWIQDRVERKLGGPAAEARAGAR